MKFAILLAFVGACGTSTPNDPHEIVACEGYYMLDPVSGTKTPVVAQCEAACQKATSTNAPPSGTGADCQATSAMGVSKDCPLTFSFGDARGCCVEQTGGDVLYSFYECQ